MNVNCVLLLLLAFVTGPSSEKFSFVQNGSFEILADTLHCGLVMKDRNSFASTVTGWQTANLTYPSLHTSAVDSRCSFYSLNEGLAKEGNVFLSLLVFEKDGNGGGYVQNKLKKPLVTKKTHTVQIWMKPSEFNKYTCNNIGIYFSKQPFFDPTFNRFSNLNPHVLFRHSLTDTLEWTLLQGSFYASEPFEYLTIGYFGNEETEHLEIIRGTGYFENGVRMLLDDIEVYEQGER